MSAVTFEIDWDGFVQIDKRGERLEHGWESQPLLPSTEALTTVGITDDEEGYMLRLTTFHAGEKYHVVIELPLDQGKVESLLQFLHFIRQRMA